MIGHVALTSSKFVYTLNHQIVGRLATYYGGPMNHDHIIPCDQTERHWSVRQKPCWLYSASELGSYNSSWLKGIIDFRWNLCCLHSAPPMLKRVVCFPYLVEGLMLVKLRSWFRLVPFWAKGQTLEAFRLAMLEAEGFLQARFTKDPGYFKIWNLKNYVSQKCQSTRLDFNKFTNQIGLSEIPNN